VVVVNLRLVDELHAIGWLRVVLRVQYYQLQGASPVRIVGYIDCRREARVAGFIDSLDVQNVLSLGQHDLARESLCNLVNHQRHRVGTNTNSASDLEDVVLNIGPLDLDDCLRNNIAFFWLCHSQGWPYGVNLDVLYGLVDLGIISGSL